MFQLPFNFAISPAHPHFFCAMYQLIFNRHRPCQLKEIWVMNCDTLCKLFT